MANSSKRKGDRAELEVQGILRDLFGIPARRKLGAGRKDDTGDMDGLPGHVISVVAYGRHDFMAAVKKKPLECEEQRERAGVDFAATFVKLPGGGFRVVLTPEQWATYVRDASIW